jgi:hypothetical protein
MKAHMFFRREKPRKLTFEDWLQQLKDAGFSVKPDGPGRARVSKLGSAAIIEATDGDQPKVGKAGIVIGDEIGFVVHGGYQMFLQTPSGRREPALASHLKALHAFQEDLKEGLGMTSLYNTSLGTIADKHMYDRVQDRDRGIPRRF